MSGSSGHVRIGTTPTLHLHARVFHCDDGPPGQPWYVDIDDLDDQQPDDPFWYGHFGSQTAALAAACSRLATLAGEPADLDQPARISHNQLPRAILVT